MHSESHKYLQNTLEYVRHLLYLRNRRFSPKQLFPDSFGSFQDRTVVMDRTVADHTVEDTEACITTEVCDLMVAVSADLSSVKPNDLCMYISTDFNLCSSSNKCVMMQIPLATAIPKEYWNSSKYSPFEYLTYSRSQKIRLQEYPNCSNGF